MGATIHKPTTMDLLRLQKRLASESPRGYKRALLESVDEAVSKNHDVTKRTNAKTVKRILAQLR